MGIDEGAAGGDGDVVGRVKDGVVVVCAIGETEEVTDIAVVAMDKTTDDTGVPKPDVG